ncbi:MAG: glycosyltransferase family 9 protein [Verrucomicrobium sp.]|nr:glycosyltransferase family 9 protein [Verrucomicrobium sp.]
MKILIVKPSSFGDVIQSLPVATGLRRHWPDARIHWLVFTPYEPLLRGHPAIDQVVSLPPALLRPGKWLSLWKWLGALRAENYDMVLDLQGLLRSGLLTWLTRAPVRLGLATAREGSTLFYTETILEPPPPAQEKYLEFLRHLGIRPDPFAFGLQPPPLAQPGLEPRRYVVLHPYTRWQTKLWPWRYYQEVVNALPEVPFVVVGQGPWFPLEGANVTDLRDRLTLPKLMSVLSEAAAVVSPDSGPSHLAAALGVPTLALFGATDWRKTRPIGPRVAIERYPVPCSPCLKRVCPQKIPMVCMSEITPIHVVRYLSHLLGLTVRFPGPAESVQVIRN